MKPILSTTDYNILRELIKNTSASQRTKEIKQLTEELNKAIVLDDNQVGNSVVRLNSIVDVVNIDLGKRMSFKIVLPAAANVQENKISVFAQMSIALIGFKENDVVQWEMPSGKTYLKIIHVNNEETESKLTTDTIAQKS